MRNNKGINLVALIIMIIVMIMIAAIAINVSMDSYENSLEAKAAAERQQVTIAISSRFGDHQRNSTANPLVGLMILEEKLDTEQSTIDYLCDKFKNEYGKLMTDDELANSTQRISIEHFVYDNFEDMKYTRILLYTDLLELGIENTNMNAVYLVNYYSNDVVGPIS